MEEKETATEVSELDALRLENLHLKADAAAEAFARAKDAFLSAVGAAAALYGFDPARGDAVDYATRKITRK